MGYIGSSLNPKKSSFIIDYPPYQRIQREYCDRCYFVSQQNNGTTKLCKPKASMSYAPLQFCASCGWRYLAFKAASITKFAEMTIESLTDHRTLRLSGSAEWITFVIEEDMGLIMAAWSMFPLKTRETVDDVDGRDIEEQLKVTIGARNAEVSHARH